LDVLCVPTIPRFYSVADLEADPVTPNSRLGTYTNFVNLMGLCGIAVPTDTRADNRPGSVTLLAPSGQDGLAAALASRLHEEAGPKLGATDAPVPASCKQSGVASKGEIAIAVVGAHMSGLALSHQLTERGGRFLEATSTAPEYRFFALPGGPPHRPGLLLSSEGRSIELEIWALPSEQFGSFMAGIPDPLCIGTVKLLDGRTVKGFLVEHWATAHAKDITASKGWRGYLESLQPEGPYAD
ncbi:MAG: allophanate hydrolase, partial [Pseudomonadota bacterium]